MWHWACCPGVWRRPAPGAPVTWVPAFGELTLCVSPVSGHLLSPRGQRWAVSPVPGEGAQHHGAPASDPAVTSSVTRVRTLT